MRVERIGMRCRRTSVALVGSTSDAPGDQPVRPYRSADRARALAASTSRSLGGAVVHGPRFFEQPTCHWRPQVTGGVLAEESAELLRDFFRARRKKKG